MNRTLVIIPLVIGCGGGGSPIAASRFGQLTDPIEREAPDREIAAACGPFVQANRSALKRLPYVQAVTTETAKVLWSDYAATPSTLAVHDAEGSRAASVSVALDPGMNVRNGFQKTAAVNAQVAANKTTYENASQALSGELSAFSPPLDDDLAEIVEAWPTLPEPIRAGIVAMVRASGSSD